MKYPIGIQSFEQIVKEGYLYIDKTAQVYDLVKNGKTYFLCRPRRFGKSLLVSTLECYFLASIPYSQRRKDNERDTGTIEDWKVEA